MFEFMCFLQSGGQYAKTKFKESGDAFLWEAEGLYFKFDPKSRDLHLTNNAKKATLFKVSPPVIKSPSLSHWVSSTVTFIFNTYTCKYILT